jgi:hypothetical protein
MIGTLSGSVPWVGAVFIALIAAAGGPAAIIVQNRHQDTARKNDLKHAAYERLIAASEVVAVRTMAVGVQRSAVRSFVHTLYELRKATVAYFLAFTLKKWPEMVRTVMDAIPTPVQSEESMDLSSLQLAIEELLKANIAVNLYGSNRAIGAAHNLLGDAKGFYELIESSNWTWGGLPNKKIMSEARGKMVSSTSEFVAVARSELKLKEPKH